MGYVPIDLVTFWGRNQHLTVGKVFRVQLNEADAVGGKQYPQLLQELFSASFQRISAADFCSDQIAEGSR